MLKKQPERIICDVRNKAHYPLGFTCQKVVDMYSWLLAQGILEKVCFAFRNYPNTTYFAFDAEELLPYRKQMEESGVKGAEETCCLIFDEQITPCMYTGAIQFHEPMLTYRDNCGCVGRSREITLVRHLGNEAANNVLDLNNKKGSKAAILHLFTDDTWSDTFTCTFVRKGNKVCEIKHKPACLAKAVV